jgi:alpha-tubulin suppressor-like RCC1 family protein
MWRSFLKQTSLPAWPIALLISAVTGCGEPEPASPNQDSALPSQALSTATPPCTGCSYYQDTLKAVTSIKFEPDAGFYDVTTSGIHTGWLVGPSGTDFALRLMKWDAPNNRWLAIKTSNVANSSSETLSYSGAPGRYRWRIWSLSGSGTYQFWFQRPGQSPPIGYVFRSIGAAGQNACAITTSNVGYCWGHGAFGQIGNGSATAWANIPQRVLNEPWDTIAVSHYTTCGLQGGKAFCWGSDNHWGALGQGSVLSSCASPYSSTPCSLVPLPVVGNHTFSWLAAGGNGDRSVGPPYSRFACGIESGGQAWCWGSDNDGELGDGAQYPNANPTPIPGAIGVTWSRIWAGMDHACGIDRNGKAYCWGSELIGELGDNAPPPQSVPTPYGAVPRPVAVLGGLTFKQVDAGRLHSCGVTVAGKVYCWGSNYHGELGTPQTPDCSSDPRYPNPCSPVPVPIASSLTFSYVTAGTDHTCALQTTGAIWCWGITPNVGAGNPGGIGGAFPCYSSARNTQTTCINTPIKTATSVGFTQVDAGMDFTCALSTSGQVFCWGSDFYGLAQTGTAQYVPKQINQPTG